MLKYKIPQIVTLTPNNTYSTPVINNFDAIKGDTNSWFNGSVVILGGLTFVNFPLCIHLC